MSSKEVPNLPAAAELDGAEEIHIVQGGNSRRATLAEILALVPAPVLPTVLRLVTVQVLTSTPTANEILALYPTVDAFTLPANLAGSKVSVITNPTAVFTITIARQVAGAGAFATIATITIAVDGTVTLATTGGGAKAIAAGDVLKITGDADGDATFIGAATILGQQ